MGFDPPATSFEGSCGVPARQPAPRAKRASHASLELRPPLRSMTRADRPTPEGAEQASYEFFPLRRMRFREFTIPRIPAPGTFPSQRFARSQGLSPLGALRACSIPLAPLGFRLQGFSPTGDPCSLRSRSSLAVAEPTKPPDPKIQEPCRMLLPDRPPRKEIESFGSRAQLQRVDPSSQHSSPGQAVKPASRSVDPLDVPHLSEAFTPSALAPASRCLPSRTSLHIHPKVNVRLYLTVFRNGGQARSRRTRQLL